MCGIAGILFKQQAGPIGDILIKMLADLNRRGPDSTGVALYGNLPKGNLVVRIKVDEDAQEETIDWEEMIVETAREPGSGKQSSRTGRCIPLMMEIRGSRDNVAPPFAGAAPGG